MRFQCFVADRVLRLLNRGPFTKISPFRFLFNSVKLLTKILLGTSNYFIIINKLFIIIFNLFLIVYNLFIVVGMYENRIININLMISMM